MKKLLFTLLACLLAVPMFALYNEGEKVKVRVWNGEWEQKGENMWQGGLEEVELTCYRHEDGGYYLWQTCYSADDMTKIFLDDDAQDSDVYNEIETTKASKNVGKDGKLWVSMTISCPGKNHKTFVEFKKFQQTEDAEEVDNPGYVVESLSKTVEGVGRVSLLRFYKPDGEENKPDGEEKEAAKKNFRKFDVHRLNRAEREAGVTTDFTRFCDDSYLVK